MRYNQRGVGRSKGSRFAIRNLRGQLDAGDVPTMVEFLAEKLQTTSKNPKIVVIGYSFGACLAAYALQDPRVALYIGISFPLGGLSNILNTKEGFERLISNAVKMPRLLVLGSTDQYTKVAVLEAAVSGAGGRMVDQSGNGEVGGGGTLLFKVYPENGHFWETDSALMVESCIEFCGKYLENLSGNS